MDRLMFMRNTRIVLNTSCSDYSILHEGEPRRRVPWCSPPELRVGSPLDPSPKPSVAVCQGRRAPDDSYPPFYIVCEACDDVHQ